MNISEAIAKYINQEGGTCFFHYDEAAKTWCLSGETVDHLGWETDDIEAANRNEAEADATDFLTENNDLA